MNKILYYKIEIEMVYYLALNIVSGLRYGTNKMLKGLEIMNVIHVKSILKYGKL